MPREEDEAFICPLSISAHALDIHNVRLLNNAIHAGLEKFSLRKFVLPFAEYSCRCVLASRGDFRNKSKNEVRICMERQFIKSSCSWRLFWSVWLGHAWKKTSCGCFLKSCRWSLPPRFAQTRQQRNFYSSSSVLIKRKSTTTPSTHVFPTSFCDKNLSSFVFPFCVLMLVLVTRQFGYFNSEARKETGEALYIPHPHSPLV